MKLLQLIGGHFMDYAAVAVRCGKSLRGTGDNWDMQINPNNVRRGIKKKDLHLFASTIYVNRVNFDNLSRVGPKRDLETCSRNVFTLNVLEMQVLRENFMILIGRICLEYMPAFKLLSPVIPFHISHRFSKEMEGKSTVIPLPILNLNEMVYQDIVQILRVYEKWIYEINVKAGVVQAGLFPEDHPQLQNDNPLPDQPRGHLVNIDDDDDIMRGIRVPFGGDQATRVRAAGAKDMVAGCHLPVDRVEHCAPFKPAMFHTKANFLKQACKLLHSSESVNEVGTLMYFATKYDRKDYCPKKPLDSYEATEELFLSAGKAYILKALLDYFGMLSVDDQPITNNPEELKYKSIAEKNEYFRRVIGEFVDTYIFQRGRCPSHDDYIQNYALLHAFLTMVLLQIKDTAAEGDGDRNLINQKLLLTIFKSISNSSKYAIEMFVAIAQVECLYSEQLAEELKWGYFSSWKGGKGKNVEDDRTQEILIKISKNVVKRMGANKSIKSIETVTKAVGGIRQLAENFDKDCCIHPQSSKHSKRDSKPDELSMLEDLATLNPFQYAAGRSHKSFPGIKRHPMKYMDIQDFHIWLDKHKKQMSNV